MMIRPWVLLSQLFARNAKEQKASVSFCEMLVPLEKVLYQVTMLLVGYNSSTYLYFPTVAAVYLTEYKTIQRSYDLVTGTSSSTTYCYGSHGKNASDYIQGKSPESEGRKLVVRTLCNTADVIVVGIEVKKQ